jgi:hypothetical protein
MGPNTYTFLQASSTHFWRWRFGEASETDWDNTSSSSCLGDYYTGGPPFEIGYNYKPIGGKNTDPVRSLNEESRAVIEYSLYLYSNQNPSTWDGSGGLNADGVPLVSPTMKNAVEGRTVTAYWPVWQLPFGIRVGGGIHWQRTYYRLKDWECKDYMDYINDFAVRR